MSFRVWTYRAAFVAMTTLAAGERKAHAQTPAATPVEQTFERSGFFIGLGLGYGSLDITCDGCEVDREGGLSGYFKLGGAVSSQVLLGVESNGWYKSEEGTSITFGTLTGSVYLYPSPAANFYLRGGAGLATFAVEDFDTETGFGWSVGLGYDIPIGRKSALTPFANLSFGHINDATVNVLQAGLGINWY
jgi:hypothetical protein